MNGNDALDKMMTVNRQELHDGIARMERTLDRHPTWAFRAMAEELATTPACHRDGDGCESSGDCITEWCPFCYARRWIEDDNKRQESGL